MAKTNIYPTFLKFSMLGFVLLAFVFSSSAVVVPSTTPEPVSKESIAVSPFSKMSVDDFLSLTPKKYKELTGEKLSIPQRISLKLAQRKIKKAIKNNEQIDSTTMANIVDTSDFNIGGFVLGLLLSVIGVLIAYLIDDTSVIKWAWVGFGIFLIIFLLAVLL
jgi:hypothetical protein